MKIGSHHKPEGLWARVVMRKWLNFSNKDSDYSADTDDDYDDDTASDSDMDEHVARERESRFRKEAHEGEASAQSDFNDALLRFRRRNSETFRAQYINTKEVRVCVGTWNVGGLSPPEDLDIDEWIHINEPADVYVLGFQEIVPLNAGNVLGAEDSRPVAKWENTIREALNRIHPKVSNIKSYSDPPSPTKFKPRDDLIQEIEEEISLGSESDFGEEIHPLDEESDSYGLDDAWKDNEAVVDDVNTAVPEPAIDSFAGLPVTAEKLQRQFSSGKRLDRIRRLRMAETEEDTEEPGDKNSGKTLNRLFSTSERIGLSWPEPPLNLLNTSVFDRSVSFKSAKSFTASKSFRARPSFKTSSTTNQVHPDVSSLAEIDLETLMRRKRRPPYVRLVSKQLVGLFLTIWVRRGLRKHIQNVRVSTVGVGVMGYIGNKGSVAVSMSIYQTMFCFICTHLTAGEKDVDNIKRNADVNEIRKRTIFRPLSSIGLPKLIHDHERIIWLGDLNYRLNLSYEKTRELVSMKDWFQLREKDQLVREFRKGRTFDGWSEGTLNFPPTYKYEMNSEKYVGEDPKAGRRTPAWCDRILSYGKGIKQTSYRRSEHRLSDHRPVTATYVVEVEVFSPRKLQRALTFTDAEIENDERLVAET